MKKLNIPITSSISGYCLVLSILKYLEFGISNVLWLLILIFILGFLLFNPILVPAIVPPVPIADTNALIFPFVYYC